ncbi:hypothetical protein B566_EDAN009257 [Ephemera danica]|nr:hypothetical protein B566_EDAN009257 [Ephemera danica]
MSRCVQYQCERAIRERQVDLTPPYRYLPEENRALRLKEPSALLSEDIVGLQSLQQVQQQQPESVGLGRPLPAVSPGAAFSEPVGSEVALADSRLTWRYFDERGYIERGRLHAGEDPYQRNKFNQAESDRLPSNRDIPDTRHHM